MIPNAYGLRQMRKFGFTLRQDQSPAGIYERIKEHLVLSGFVLIQGSEKVESEADHFSASIAAKKEKPTLGDKLRARAGELRFSASGVKGKTLALGLDESFLGRNLEAQEWEDLVHVVEPTSQVCNLDGLVFGTSEEYLTHLRQHELTKLAIKNKMAAFVNQF